MPDALPLPDGLRPRGPGRKLWRETTATFEGWAAHELALLGEACRVVDELEGLRGRSDTASRVERRALRAELRRTFAALRLPDLEVEGDDELAARRPGSTASERARHAANVRWSREGT